MTPDEHAVLLAARAWVAARAAAQAKPGDEQIQKTLALIERMLIAAVQRLGD